MKTNPAWSYTYGIVRRLKSYVYARVGSICKGVMRAQQLGVRRSWEYMQRSDTYAAIRCAQELGVYICKEVMRTQQL